MTKIVPTATKLRKMVSKYDRKKDPKEESACGGEGSGRGVGGGWRGGGIACRVWLSTGTRAVSKELGPAPAPAPALATRFSLHFLSPKLGSSQTDLADWRAFHQWHECVMLLCHLFFIQPNLAYCFIVLFVFVVCQAHHCGAFN